MIIHRFVKVNLMKESLQNHVDVIYFLSSDGTTNAQSIRSQKRVGSGRASFSPDDPYLLSLPSSLCMMMRSSKTTAIALFLFLVCYDATSGEDQVQSKFLSTVSDGAGGYKIVNGIARKAILRANFTNKINTTG